MAVELATLEQAAAVLRAVWDGIDAEYKSRYRREIWQQLQARTAAHARMTNDLATLCSRLCGTFDGAVMAPYDTAARAYIGRLLYAPRSEQQAILRALREQTAVCVLLLRTQKLDEREIGASTHGD